VDELTGDNSPSLLHVIFSPKSDVVKPHLYICQTLFTCPLIGFVCNNVNNICVYMVGEVRRKGILYQYNEEIEGAKKESFTLQGEGQYRQAPGQHYLSISTLIILEF
jgi:hypothetical protein